MSISHNRSSPTPPRTSPAWRPNFGRAARRGIRQAAAIARKEEFHSFRVHADGTVTWTIRHERPEPGKPKPTGGEGGDSRKREPSQRVVRSRARAAAHNELNEKARHLRAVFLIRRWARMASPTPPPELQQPMAMPQSPQGAAPSSAKRACSATATPVKAATESSEEAGGVGRPQGCAARVQVGAQRARMYSPSGGPATGQLHGPAANADGRAPGVLRNTGFVPCLSSFVQPWAASALTPLGLWAQGVRPAPAPARSWALGTAARTAPTPAGSGAIARSEVRWLPPAGYYPLAAGRVLRNLPPPPGGRRGVVTHPPEGGRG